MLGGGYTTVGVKIPGRDARSSNVGQLVVSDKFFSIMGIPMLMGRELDTTDAGNGPKTAVANESFAREYFPGENPLGKLVMAGSHEYRIVGLCRDAKIKDLRSDSAILYYPYRQGLPGSMVFEIRSEVPPEFLVPSVRKALAAVAPGIPLTEVHTQAEQIDRLLMMERLFATSCVFLALLALLLSCIGLYGLVAYNVERPRFPNFPESNGGTPNDVIPLSFEIANDRRIKMFLGGSSQWLQLVPNAINLSTMTASAVLISNSPGNANPAANSRPGSYFLMGDVFFAAEKMS